MPKRVQFYARGQSFVRDGWASQFKWGPTDFMFHAMKYQDDVVFKHRLRVNECANDKVWFIPLKEELKVDNVDGMKSLWVEQDALFYKTPYALTSRLADCWPDCLHLIV